jgi:hypothetical protein
MRDSKALVIATLFACTPYAFCQDTCWPQKPPTHPAGTADEVVRQAADFLVKAEGVPVHPYWPKKNSGITIGAGWDAGYHTRDELRETWSALGDDKLNALQVVAGKKGPAAQASLGAVQAIEIPRSISMDVLKSGLKNKDYPFVIQVFPGLEKLPAAVQVAFISLVFNRGGGMGREPDWATAKALDQRWEMRRMRDDVRRADFYAIYAHLGIMKRLWEGDGHRGLRVRRRDEQALVRPFVDEQLRWEQRRDKLKDDGLPPCDG